MHRTIKQLALLLILLALTTMLVHPAVLSKNAVSPTQTTTTPSPTRTATNTTRVETTTVTVVRTSTTTVLAVLTITTTQLVTVRLGVDYGTTVAIATLLAAIAFAIGFIIARGQFIKR